MGSTSRCEMKLTSQTIACGAPASARRQLARVEALAQRDARVRREARVELAVADVDRDHLRAPRVAARR